MGSPSVAGAQGCQDVLSTLMGQIFRKLTEDRLTVRGSGRATVPASYGDPREACRRPSLELFCGLWFQGKDADDCELHRPAT